MLCSKKSLYNMHLSLIYMNLQSLSQLQISLALNRTLSNSNRVGKEKATLKWKASFNWQLQLLLIENWYFSLTHRVLPWKGTQRESVIVFFPSQGMPTLADSNLQRNHQSEEELSLQDKPFKNFCGTLT